MMGLSLAYLPEDSLQEAAQSFWALQEEFDLAACELHMETIQFSTAFCYEDTGMKDLIQEIRKRVSILGIHLPYLDLNPISASSRVVQFAMDTYQDAISSAGRMGADYVVFHARGHHGLDGNRQQELALWQETVGKLSTAARRSGIVFCFENADDVRQLYEVEQILSANPYSDFCLDIGHLFERVTSINPWQRLMVKCCDRYLPHSALWGKGLPFYQNGGIGKYMQQYSGRIRCIHLHNHNGKMAHCPLRSGKINMNKLIQTLNAFPHIPVILEADYRMIGMEKLREDLVFLKEAGK